MRQLMIGIVLGSLVTSGLGWAQNIYDRHGQPAAPAGSIQQFDYFKNRQQMLDVGAMRREAERQRLERLPCGR